MKTYLITGGAGFIGSNLCKKIIKKNRIIILDNFTDNYDVNIKEKNISELLKNNNCKLYHTDIRNRESLKKIFDENKIDIVVHLAAMVGVRDSINNPIIYQEVNCIGTQNILEEMKSHNVKNFVMASSGSVYGNCKGMPCIENMEANTVISPYAATKKFAEILTHVYNSLYEFNVIMLRFFTVYGPHQRPDLAISKFTRLMLNNEEIPMYGDGTTARDYVYVDDIVDGISKACDYVLKNEKVYEIINLGNETPITLKKMIDEISNVLGVKVKIKELPMQPGDIKVTYASIEKARRLLGYNPKVKFEQGIKKYINWYKNNK